MKNLKKLLKLTDAILAKTDPFLLKMAKVGAELKREINSGKKFQEYSGIFSEYNDYYMDSETLLRFLKTLRQKLLLKIEDVRKRISRLLNQKHTLTYKQEIYTALEVQLHKSYDYALLRYKMYQKYQNNWEDILEPSTIQIIEEIECKHSNTSKLFRNVETILINFEQDGFYGKKLYEVNKYIEFYSIIKEYLPQYIEKINERIEVINYLRKNFVA